MFQSKIDRASWPKNSRRATEIGNAQGLALSRALRLSRRWMLNPTRPHKKIIQYDNKRFTGARLQSCYDKACIRSILPCLSGGLRSSVGCLWVTTPHHLQPASRSSPSVTICVGREFFEFALYHVRTVWSLTTASTLERALASKLLVDHWLCDQGAGKSLQIALLLLM